MKNFNTLEELREALMSEGGAVFNSRERFRLRLDSLELYHEVEKTWKHVHESRNHGFLWYLELWTRYEKPKKIAKESFEGFLTWANYIPQINESQIAFNISGDLRDEISTLKKATITIEREVEDERN